MPEVVRVACQEECGAGTMMGKKRAGCLEWTCPDCMERGGDGS